MKKKKFIYIANARIPTEKAHGHQIIKMCEAFGGINVLKVTLVVPRRVNHIRESAFDYYGVNDNFHIKYIWCLQVFTDTRIGMILQRMSFTFFATFFVVFKKPNIVYNRSNINICLFFKLLGKKTGVEFHEPPRHFLFLKKIQLRFFKKIVVVPYKIADLYKSWGVKENNILIAPNGVDLKIFDIDLDKKEALNKLKLDDLGNKKILGYTGSFKTKGEEKGILDILRALKVLGDDFVLLAAGGSDEDIDYYKKLASDLGVADKAKFFGRQKQSDLAVFQKASDALLMPFPDIAHYREHMTPMKMFEYMASKRPIISSDLPSVRVVLNEDNCVFCKSGDYKDLAEKIKFVLNNPDKVVQLVLNARKQVGDYTWQKRAEKIINFIEQ